jgi:hypothetical protein
MEETTLLHEEMLHNESKPSGSAASRTAGAVARRPVDSTQLSVDQALRQLQRV